MGAVRRCPIGDFPLGVEERDALQRVIDAGRVSEGAEVRAFEDEFADWLGVRHCVVVSSGTSALMAGLRALVVSELYPGLSDGARVLVPAVTFAATANAVQLSGFRVLFGDVDAETYCLTPQSVARETCEVVLPVHLMGYWADLKRIRQAAPKAVLVEDAAEAHGTSIGGRKVGGYGAWGAFSFYIAHTVQAGEMGAVVTDSGVIATAVRRLKAHGRACACRVCLRGAGHCPRLEDGDPRFTHLYPGYNFKANEFVAALARVQLGHVEENVERRARNELRLWRGLEELESEQLIEPHAIQAGAVMMAYPVVLARRGIRNRVLVDLEKRGVECRPLFGCLPTQQPAYGDHHQASAQFPVAEHLGADGFYVGCHQYLTDDDVDYMAKAIVDVVKGAQG